MNNVDIQKLDEIREVCHELNLALTEFLILINLNTQRLFLIHSEELVGSYLVSTSIKGPGQKDKTEQTPLGLHFIREKIGEGANPFEVFKWRISTGEIAEINIEKNLIVGRILQLEGCQQGLNKGKDREGDVVDTLLRDVYIHGTSDIAQIGNPASVGCVRMNPHDIIDLFEKVPVNTLVYLYK